MSRGYDSFAPGSQPRTRPSTRYGSTARHRRIFALIERHGSGPRRSPMSMSVGTLDHYNVSTRKLQETVKFYESVLGLVNGPRPPFDFPGAWLYSDGHPVLHLNDISPTDREQRPDSGVIDHVAFGSRGFAAMKQHLAQQWRTVPRQSGAEQPALADFSQGPEQRRDRTQFRVRNRSPAATDGRTQATDRLSVRCKVYVRSRGLFARQWVDRLDQLKEDSATAAQKHSPAPRGCRDCADERPARNSPRPRR